MDDPLAYRSSVSAIRVADLVGVTRGGEVGWDGARLNLDEVGGPLAVCDERGDVLGASPAARDVLRRVGIDLPVLPCPLPQTLWEAICSSPIGAAIDWAPERSDRRLGCTSYLIGGGYVLLMMREVSRKRRALAEQLQQQRLASMGRIAATIAHDVRAALAPIVYNAEVLAGSAHDLPQEIATLLAEIAQASSRLRRTVDGILDFARLGPPVVEPVSLRDVSHRALSLVRTLVRDRGQTLVVDVDPSADWVRGNPISIEQVILNLVLNSSEAKEGPLTIRLQSRKLTAPAGGDLVELRVSDDGPGISPHVRNRLFEPFVTTKLDGTGIGLVTAREAIRALGGELLFVPTISGATFALRLPAAPTQSRAIP